MMDAAPPTKSAATRRRQRPTLACVSCRRSKIRCDRQRPCGACVRSRHKTCSFEASPSRGLGGRRSEIASTSTDPSELERRSEYDLGPITPASSTTTPRHRDYNQLDEIHGPLSHTQGSADSVSRVPNADDLLKRVFELERRLSETTVARESTERRPEQRGPRAEGYLIDSYLAADIHAMSRGVVSKTRYFGQSHWMNGIIHFRSMLELFENQSKDAKSEALAVLNRCKALARTIKAQRNPGIITTFGTKIPTRDVADKLVDAYLRTLETVFRVLHVPSFKRDYEQYWAAPSAAGTPFIIQMQLVLAIGATLYDETFSLRKLAVQWVTEAQYWLLGPPAKGKLTITGLQIMVLLTLARETASIGGDLVWIHVGSMLRSAFLMGLHRDPSRLPKMSRLDAEVRRRLWNTILELELKSSIDSGGFPSISPDTSDTRAPADIDDEDLMDEDDESINANTGTSEEEGKRFTDMSMALALRESFRERLAIYQMLNATPFRGTYDDTIRLHRRFTTAFKTLMTKLKSFSSADALRKPSSFQCRLLEIMTRRCFLSLHLPYLGPGLKDPAFSFSRKQVTEAAVKMYSLLFPSIQADSHSNSKRPVLWTGDDDNDDANPGNLDGVTFTTEGDDIARLAVCAAGFWRLLGSQPAMITTLELQTNIHEDSSAWGPPTLRPDLLAILRHSLPYYLHRIKAGETNVKGYLFSTALAGHVQALMDGLDGSQILEPVLSAAMRTQRVCFELLRQQLETTGCADGGGADGQFDWDSLMNDADDGDWGQDNNFGVIGQFFDVSSVDCFLGMDGNFDFTSPPMPF